jgi:hypothetical protein
MSNKIIGGHNNISIGTCGSLGIQGSLGTCGTSGIHGTIGITGHQGTSGPGGFMTDWKVELMKKYPRFTIMTDYSINGPSNIIIDNNTGLEYKLTSTSNSPLSLSNIIDETEQFIQQLIIDIRHNKITSLDL